MSVHEDGFRAWQRLKQRFKTGLAARQSFVMADFSGMVARPPKSPGETIALLTETDPKMKLVEDVTGEEISEMHARSALVGILDPVTRQHTATIRSHVRPSKRSCRGSPTTRRRSWKQCRLDELKQAPLRPTTAWTPSVADTSYDSWEEYGAINAMGSQQCWACKGYSHVSRDCLHGEGKGKTSARARTHTNGARATTTACTRKVEWRTVRALMVPSRCTRRVTASLDGKNPVMASATLAVEIILHEIAPKVEEKRGFRALEAQEF